MKNQAFLTKENFDEFKRKYEEVKDTDATHFMFEGQRIHPDYAKYVIEYIEQLREERDNE